MFCHPEYLIGILRPQEVVSTRYVPFLTPKSGKDVWLYRIFLILSTLRAAQSRMTLSPGQVSAQKSLRFDYLHQSGLACRRMDSYCPWKGQDGPAELEENAS